MNLPDVEDLIQAEIDGVNAAADSARLKEILAASPDLDARFRSLQRVSEAFVQAERLDPPPGFADDVLSEVRRRQPVRGPQVGWMEALRSLLAPAPLAACACALVVGVVLGALLPPDSALFSRRDRETLSGTSLPQGRLGFRGILDRQAIAVAGGRGEAVTRLEEGLLVLDLELDAPRPVDVSVVLDGTGLAPRSFLRDGPSGGEVSIAAGEVRFSHPAGRGRYRVSFDRGLPGGKALRVRVGGGEVRELSPGREVRE